MRFETFRKALPLVGLVVLAACGGRRAPPAPAAPLVSWVAVSPAIDGGARYTGVVRARIESDLGFRVGGTIRLGWWTPGALVRRGQALMRLDPADLQLAADAARQRLLAAEADAGRAASDEGRLRGLVEAGAVSASAYDAALAARRSSAANLSAARAAAGEAGNQRRYAALVADSDGVVTEVLAQPGQVVAAGAPIVRLARAGPREALISAPETAATALPKAARAQIYGQATTVEARLREVSGAADPLTRTFAARYSLLGAAAMMAPLGATVTVSMASGAEEAVEAPLGALHDPGSGVGVWVVGRDLKVAWRPVRVLGYGDETARLAPGALAPGERIVSLGAQLLRAGQTVRLASPDAGRSAGA